jgi:manganese-dependent inorganic pyrophosphatase
MLSAIISDSLLFKSPTCTKEDIDAAESLAQTAGVNMEE